MAEDVFEIVEKDGAGRIGKLRTAHGVVETPTLVPVINPHVPVVSTDDLKKVGFEIFITNAYLLFKDEKLREYVLEKGIHYALNWDRAIMTDSGAYQLMIYGDVEISNLEVIDFQSKIGVDVGVILDVPIYKGSKTHRKKFIDETIRRAEEAYNAGYVSSDSKTIWVGPIHGVPFTELLEYSVEQMTRFPFGMYAVGSIVPLMESYQLIQLVKSAVVVKDKLPSRYPVHLFGAGHPSTFALFVLLGFDTFDSAAYALYAKDNRYLSPYGTYNLSNMQYFPCECPVCSKYTPRELMEMEYMERQHLLALHNLYVSMAEVKRIKQAIHEGNLWQLVAERAGSHSEIARAYRWLLNHKNEKAYRFFEVFEPRFKRRGLMITRMEEFNLPLIRRFKENIFDRAYIWSDVAIISTPEGANELHKLLGAQVFIIHPVFGIIPREIRSVYPLFQHMSYYNRLTKKRLSLARKFVEFLSEQGVKEFYVYDSDRDFAKKIGDFLGISETYTGQDVGILTKQESHLIIAKSLLRYQYGPGAENIVNSVNIEYSMATGRIRKIHALDVTDEEVNHVVIPEINRHAEKKKKQGMPIPQDPLQEWFFDKGNKWLLAAVIPTYFKLIPHPLMAYRFWKMFREKELRYMAIVNEEAEEFVRQGKSIFSKFIVDVDNRIRANDEIFILNENKELIAIAKAKIGAREMKEFRRGVAAENRWGFR